MTWIRGMLILVNSSSQVHQWQINDYGPIDGNNCHGLYHILVGNGFCLLFSGMQKFQQSNENIYICMYV